MISSKTQSEVNAALRANDLGLAGSLAEAAIKRGETHEILFTLAAQMRLDSGDHLGASTFYLNAVDLAPDNPGVLAAAGDAMRRCGQLKDAVALFDRSIARQPSMIAAWYGRALALEAEGALLDAEQSFTRVTELAPNAASGFSGLASMQSLRGDLTEARLNAEHAHVLGPNECGTLIALARCDMATGQHQSAVGWLQSLLRLPAIALEDEINALGLLGESLEQLDLVNESFEAYTRANQRFSQTFDLHDSRSAALDAIEAVDVGLAKSQLGEFGPSTHPVSNSVTGHIFLLGYPRSGTTLAEQILATIPNVVTLEEEPTLAAAEKYLTEDGIATFGALSEDEITELRDEYWATVVKAGIDLVGKTFVDMDPLKGSALPLIARLFPDAKIIVMHRDPRDVVWSCFKHNFIFSATTLEFVSLERTAHHYHALMSLMRRCVSTLPLNVYILSYEEVVRDFNQTTRTLCDFLSLTWSTDLRSFSDTARKRGVRTASGPQVRRALFDGTEKWRKYAVQMESIIPILEEWIDPAALLKNRPVIADNHIFTT